MKLYHCAVSDVGCVRERNEDAVFDGRLKTGDYLFVVADGMGGHHAGDVASQRAITQLVAALDAGITEPVPDLLRATFERISAALYRENQAGPAELRMGTTLTALLVRGDQANVAHVGDSRLYRYRSGQAVSSTFGELTRLTDDQSVVGMLLKNGAITEAEARVHPRRSVLNQAIGMRDRIEPQVLGPFDIQPGDTFLLCSDGLTSVVDPDEVAVCLGTPSAGGIATQLVRRARQAGGPDNISVVVVRTEPDRVTPADDRTAPELDPLANRAAPDTSRRRIVRWLLLALLLLLLVAVVYLLVDGASAGRPGRDAGAASAPAVPAGPAGPAGGWDAHG